MKTFNKQKYDNEYAKTNYDRCIFNIPKGQKAVLEAHWKSRGYKSLNSYINDLIAKDMGGGGKLIIKISALILMILIFHIINRSR